MVRASLSVLSFLCTVLIYHTAWADFFVIGAGKRAKRTVLVSPGSTPTAGGTSLLNALAKITDATSDRPYLIHVEPGIFDVGTDSVVLKPYVDIEGSGIHVTRIRGTAETDQGVVAGADQAELRFITVENTGGEGGATSVAISCEGNESSPRLTHVRAIARGRKTNYAIANRAWAVMTHVEAEASGGSESIGILNEEYVVDSGGEMHSFSIFPKMSDVRSSASGANTNSGIVNSDANPEMINVVSVASGGSFNCGVNNSASEVGTNVTMANVISSASGDGSSTNVGIRVDGAANDAESIVLSNTISRGFGGSSNYGFQATSSSDFDVEVNRSTISGETHSVLNNSDYPIRIGASQLKGTVSTLGSGSTHCMNSYNEEYQTLDADCHVGP